MRKLVKLIQFTYIRKYILYSRLSSFRIIFMSKKYIIISLIAFILSSGILYLWLSLGRIDTLIKETTIIETNKESKSTTSGEIWTDRLYNSFLVEWENVYWIDRNHPNEKNIIDWVDAKTFELLNECKHQWCYAKDKSRVYLLSEMIRVVGLDIIWEANPNTFRLLTGSYSRDENNIFCNWNKISWIDIDRFRTLGQRYATDNTSVYWDCHKIDGIDDPKSLMLEENGDEVTLQDQNFIYQITWIWPEETQVEKIAKNISFSPSQISEILAKIDENTKKQQEIKKSATGVLIQGNFWAEYIAPKDYGKDTDKIIINLPWERYEFSGVYGKEEMTKYLNTIKDGWCKIEKWQNTTNSVLVNSTPHEHPASWDCLMQKTFGKFSSFSPSWNYLLYYLNGWEYQWVILIDSRTGKTVIKIDYPEFNIWTLDKKQFIFAGWGEFGWCTNGCWLHITIKDSFPQDKILTNDFISGWYVDESQLYVKTYNYNSNKMTIFLKIYNLTTLKEIFSQEIK